MATTRFIQNTFTSGVLSPLIKGRTDIAQYYQGLEVGDDWVLLPQGGVKRRPGTQYIDLALPVLTRDTTAATVPNGGTAGNINDDNDATLSATTVNISTLDPYVVAHIDLGAAVLIETVDVRGIFLTSLTSNEFRVQWSDDNVTFFNAAIVPLTGTASQNFRLKSGQSTAHRYWRLARIGSADLGTDKVTISGFSLYTRSATLSEVKIKDFSVETDRHYLIALSDKACRIYSKASGLQVADIKTPYTSAEVMDVRDVQSEQVMLLFHPDHAPQRIINLGTDTDWSLDDVPFTNVPQFDYNDSLSPTPVNEVQVMTFTAFVAGDTFQIDVEGVLSKNITYAGDTTADERSATEENIRKNLQDMPTFGDTGIAVARTGAAAYTVTISGESTKAFELFTAFATSGTATKTVAITKSATGSPRAEDVWSSARGYPKTACFYDGRLVLGGTKSKPQSLFMSKAGSFYNFDIDDSDDDEAIFITISSRQLNNIVDVYPGRNLQIFTDGAEFTISGSPVTPSTVTVKAQTSHGSLNLEAKEIDGATLFIDRNGKSIKEYVYNFNEDAYIARDVSVLSPELINTPTDLAILGGTSSDDANWVFIVNADGQATVLNTLREQDIKGFTRWTTTGFITNVSVVDDELYMVNKRTINGVLGYYIERWSFNHRLDCSLKSTNVAPTDLVSGFTHFIGQSVSIVADNAVLPDRVVNSSGQLELSTSEEAHVNFEAGILFTPTLQAFPVATNVGSGINQTRIRKIVRMNLRVIDAYGVYIEGRPVPIRAFGEASASPLDTAPVPKTGIIGDFYSTAGFDRYDSMPIITLPEPTSCTILSVEYEVESG